MTVNPYTPPFTAPGNVSNPEDRAQSVKRGSALYRWMGWIGIMYFCVACPLVLWLIIRDPPFQIGAAIGTGLVTMVFVSIFASMIRLATSLQTDFNAVYSRARWTGLLVGAFGFPFLTIPAFYAVWLIERGRPDARSGDEPSVPPESAS